MATLKPFYGIRPEKSKAALVAALPYDVLSTEEARIIGEKNPYSFLHIDKAEIDLDKNIDPYDERVYKKAAENLNRMRKEGVLIQEDKAVFYIYRLTMEHQSQTGLVACTSIDEYMNGIIKKHEFTREDKEIDRIKHVDYCNANTGPIFLAYRGEAAREAEEILDTWTREKEPVYDFVADDDIEHTVWVLDAEDIIQKLVTLFRDVPALYIADGHHRNASAVKVGLKRRQDHPEYTGEEEYNYYLSVIFPAWQLRILAYNRIVKDLNGLTAEEFLKKLEEKFHVFQYSQEGVMRPGAPKEFGMYLGGRWYLLRLRHQFASTDPVEGLDVALLQNFVLTPLLGIQDIRKDKRIDFIGGGKGLAVLKEAVDRGEAKVAFSMYPTSMEDLMKVADEGKVMPPKSTWFEPKLRSGLVIHSLEEK